ncbi:hypothetical protein RQP54_18920 [Curvibacter sp. APW13]|uniref:hypothetical protein n=1 Tax=Curvibacter sp. APW13 TaxID=3077236 RepID=UPI0028DEC3C8|nr:hypothetical protein [Curvibacter sp. APW13]MDT8992953.1 hypothetical protein [Curvibacter sp. APW13]
MSRPLLTTRQMALPLALGLAMPMMSVAQTANTPSGTTTTTSPSNSTANDRLAASYATWAGSTANARSLVNGLSTGSTVSLSGSTGSTSFSPSTGKMGVGETGIALSLAKASLAKQGITNPTPAQISAALNGGTVTVGTKTTTLNGVLSQRASGMGWGQVAHANGVKLGAVVSASKTDKSKAAEAGHKDHRKEGRHDKESRGHESHGKQSDHERGGGREGHGGGHEGHGGGDHGGGGKK